MDPYYDNGTSKIYNADCRDMSEIPDGSIQCCVTSPPYWGLRDYGTATWEGGDPLCQHKQPLSRKNSSTLSGGKDTVEHAEEGYRKKCAQCGAIRHDAGIGLESTPEEYVAKIVEVFREVRRALNDSGVLWLNMGDSYYGSWANYGGGNRFAGKQRLIKHGSHAQNPVWDGLEGYRPAATYHHPTLKPKDLVGVPWRVAFALQADGWYLRSDIIWHKPNPMPESVTDRPTKAHEYLFLLAKSQRYYYDAEAIREAAAERDDERPFGNAGGNRHGDEGRTYKSKKPDGWATHDGGHGSFHRDGREQGKVSEIRCGRNKRSVWVIPTSPYPEAHFATFPEALVEPCVLAGSRPGDIVLDPFAGSCTTLAVAQRLGRKAIGYELKAEYCDMGIKRLLQLGMTY